MHYDSNSCDLTVRFTNSNLLSEYFRLGGRVRKPLSIVTMLIAQNSDLENRNSGLLLSVIFLRKCQI